MHMRHCRHRHVEIARSLTAHILRLEIPEDTMHHHRFRSIAHTLLVPLLLVGLACTVLSRGQAAASDPYQIRLPLVRTSTQPASPGDPPEQIALDRINSYRQLAGVQPVQPHGALTAAAEHHASYDLLNYGDQSAWSNGPHGEVAGKPGFTGQTAADRMAATQFPFAPNAEVMNYFDDPIRSVDGWMSTVFHRIGILYPTSWYAGYGHGRNAVELVDVVDFGRGPSDLAVTPGVVVFPAPDQTDVPLYGASETPSPLPPGAQYPIGYPITLQPIAGANLAVTQAELRDADARIAVYPNPPGCSSACYALIPTVGLRPSTMYCVHVAGSVDGAPFDKTWSFTTSACLYPGVC